MASSSNSMCLSSSIVVSDEECGDVQEIFEQQSQPTCCSADVTVKIEGIDFEVERSSPRKRPSRSRRTSRMSVSRKPSIRRYESDDCIIRIKPIKISDRRTSSPMSNKLAPSLSSNNGDNDEVVAWPSTSKVMNGESFSSYNDISKNIEPTITDNISEVSVVLDDIPSTEIPNKYLQIKKEKTQTFSVRDDEKKFSLMERSSSCEQSTPRFSDNSTNFEEQKTTEVSDSKDIDNCTTLMYSTDESVNSSFIVKICENENVISGKCHSNSVEVMPKKTVECQSNAKLSFNCENLNSQSLNIDEFVSNNSQILAKVNRVEVEKIKNNELLFPNTSKEKEFCMHENSSDNPVLKDKSFLSLSSTSCNVDVVQNDSAARSNSRNLSKTAMNYRNFLTNVDPLLVQRFNLKEVWVVVEDINKKNTYTSTSEKLLNESYSTLPSSPSCNVSKNVISVNTSPKTSCKNNPTITTKPYCESTEKTPININNYLVNDPNTAVDEITSCESDSKTTVKRTILPLPQQSGIDKGVPTHPRVVLNRKAQQRSGIVTPNEPPSCNDVNQEKSQDTNSHNATLLYTSPTVTVNISPVNILPFTLHPSIRLSHFKSFSNDNEFNLPSSKRRRLDSFQIQSNSQKSRIIQDAPKTSSSEVISLLNDSTEDIPNVCTSQTASFAGNHLQHSIDLTNATTDLNADAKNPFENEECDVISVISRRPASPITKASRVLLLKSPTKPAGRSPLTQSLTKPVFGNSELLNRHFCVDISDSDTFCSVYTSDDEYAVQPTVVHISSDTETETESKLPETEEVDYNSLKQETEEEKLFSPTITPNSFNIPNHETPALPTFITENNISKTKSKSSTVRSLSRKQLRKLSQTFNLKKAKVSIVKLDNESINNIINLCKVRTNWTDKETLIKAGLSRYDAMRLGLKATRKTSGNTRYGFREMVYKKRNLFQGSPKKRIRKKRSPKKELDFLKSQRRRLREIKNEQRKHEAEQRELESIRRSLLKINARFLNQNRFWCGLNS